MFARGVCADVFVYILMPFLFLAVAEAADPVKCNPPHTREETKGGTVKCVWNCHETSLPGNNSEASCVCPHFWEEAAEKDSEGRIVCVEHFGKCANWFGHIRSDEWQKVEDIAERHGNTPWATMKDNECTRAVLGKDYVYNCGLMLNDKTHFISCHGDCVAGKCANVTKEEL